MISNHWYCIKDKKRNEWYAENIPSFLFIPLTFKRVKGAYESADSACAACMKLNKVNNK